MDMTVFEDIGLTAAEAKVYLALLELGSSAAGPVVEKSGLQNSVVHRALHKLIEKGAVTYILEGKKKTYQAINPKLLVNIIEDKKKRFEEMLPELMQKQKTSKKKIEASIYRGRRGVKELLNQILERASEINAKDYSAYGGSQKSSDLLGDAFWSGFHNKRIKKRIRARLIFHSSLKWWGHKLRRKKLTDVRFTERGFEELTETIICGNVVGIIIYTDEPYGFLIEEEAVAHSYMKFFEMLWKEAKR